MGRDRGARRRGRLGPRRRHLDRARLQHPLGRIAPAAVPPRPAVLRAAVRPALHGVLEPRRLRLQRPAPADHARGRSRPVPDAEALVEPLQPARAPHVRLAGDRRQRGAGALPARRHLHERGHGRGAAQERPGIQGSRALADLDARLRLRRRGRRADARDDRDDAPRARPAGLAADEDGRAGRALRGARGRARRAADDPRRALLRVPPRHVHDPGAHEARQPACRDRAARRRVPRDRRGRRLPAPGARPPVEAPPPAAVPRHPPRLVHPARLRGRRARSGARSRPARTRSRRRRSRRSAAAR